ncbi:MAG: hypothetical protein Q9169_008701, partial [Polycauliona sp. 2 TL-2023]
YIPVVPSSGAITPWLNGCKTPKSKSGGDSKVQSGGSSTSPSDTGGQAGGKDNEVANEEASESGGDESEGGTTAGGVGDVGSGTRPESGPGSGLGDITENGGEDGGLGANSSQSAPEPILLPPSIWTAQDPVVQCEPPCIFVLPPYQLSFTTTITFPPYTTILDVAWLTTAVTTAPDGAISTVESYDRTLQETVLTIPPIITTAIEVWNIRLTDLNQPSSLSFDITSSVAPPPFQITDDPNPEDKPGVNHPPVVRMITPPPFPYIQTMPDPNFPVMKFKPGPPPAVVAPCIINCGRPCVIFCDKPCLIGCGPGTDFPGPNDPDPPQNPNKKPPPPGPDRNPDDKEEKSSSECSTKTASSCGVE